MRKIVGLTLASVALALPSAAAARDRDHDGLPDAWERGQHLSTKKASANGDPDRDRVDNRNELQQGTKPRRRDSDRDGRPDGREDLDRDGLSGAAEDLTGNDPRDRDSDDDGTRDGKEPVGVVSSVEGGVVTIVLARGGSVGVLVIEDTQVECMTEDEAEAYYSAVKRPSRGRRRGRRAKRGRRAAAASYTARVGDQEELEEDEESEEEEEEDEEEDAGEDDASGDEYEFGSCPPDALKPGTRVQDAEIGISDDGFELESIALLR